MTLIFVALFHALLCHLGQAGARSGRTPACTGALRAQSPRFWVHPGRTPAHSGRTPACAGALRAHSGLYCPYPKVALPKGGVQKMPIPKGCFTQRRFMMQSRKETSIPKGGLTQSGSHERATPIKRTTNSHPGAARVKGKHTHKKDHEWPPQSGPT